MKKATSPKRGRTLRTVQTKSLRDLMKVPYKIELTPLSKDDGGGYLAINPLLSGCQSDGKTPDEAIQNLREAQKAWFSSALKHNDPVPLPRYDSNRPSSIDERFLQL